MQNVDFREDFANSANHAFLMSQPSSSKIAASTHTSASHKNSWRRE